MKKAREYRSTSGISRRAWMELCEYSYGPYNGRHVFCHTESSRGTSCGHFGSYAEAFGWLMGAFGCGWTRVR